MVELAVCIIVSLAHPASFSSPRLFRTVLQLEHMAGLQTLNTFKELETQFGSPPHPCHPLIRAGEPSLLAVTCRHPHIEQVTDYPFV
ncbi:hypothetical protein HBH98_023830 [Parastagonospora nodorum]|nr:hypothetical protein HBH53_076360 [Parastagonospora nodorum]KAH3986705.1 hypothetical protein HBH51_009450 [Parastagonospora nodorum]KAH4033243.1 hypothetical protein HBI13_008100 [Parastagonospora nodorum]KAH4042048.1 hypothetical protein HBI09_008040 [Parastagonospora nodorum]KAH4099505.1 hypothetical protein HBH48_008140 [Parastagonospora nodorum]